MGELLLKSMSLLPRSGLASSRPKSSLAIRDAHVDESTDSAPRVKLDEPVAAPSRAERSIAPGAEIGGKYVIEGELGSGGMGVVFAARHAALGTPLAIKVLHARLARSPDAVRRFLREARAASELASPHVARAIDAGTFGDGLPYVVMERLVGSDLERRLQEDGPLAIVDAVRFVREACAGLAVAHARGFVHRDVKPSNLFLACDEQGIARIKVLDFGIAKARPAIASDASLTVTDTAIGSPSYMSPEQVRDSKSVDARADIWGLGATLFKLLTGQVPFRGDSPMSISAAITADSPRKLRELRPSVPGPLEAVVLRCLKKSPHDRFASVDDLAAALAPFASAPNARAAFARRRSVHRVMRGAAIAIVVLLYSVLRRAHAPDASAAIARTTPEAAVKVADGPRRAFVPSDDVLVPSAAIAIAPPSPRSSVVRASVVAAPSPDSVAPPETIDAGPSPVAEPVAAAEPPPSVAPSASSRWSGGSATDDRE